MLDNPDLTDFVAAGYTLMRTAPRKDWMSAELLPEQIISLSHQGQVFEIYWGWDVALYRDDILNFGIDDNLIDAFVSWNNQISEDHNLGYPTVFDALTLPRELIKNFITQPEGLLLVGVGLHKTCLTEYHDEIANGERYYGIDKMLLQGESLLSDAIPLGYDVVGIDCGFGCGWLCSGLEREMQQLFGIRPGAWGLLQSYADAKRIVDWIDEGDVGTRAEPIPHYPWLIVQYPLEL